MKTALPTHFLRLAALLTLAPTFTLPRMAAEDAAQVPVAAESVAPAALEDAATIIARARAYLGTDAALDAVQSLHFLGMVAADDGSTRPIEIIMRRPMQEMITETGEKAKAVTVLNDYTLWRRVDPADRPGTGRVQLMNADAVRYARANVAQTLFYYRDLESVGGTVVVEGEEDVEGIRCVRTVFKHPGDIHYIRFFDKTNGRLVVTRSNGGNETRERGEMIVAGIRFPSELTTVVGGKESRVTFLDIRVNEEFDSAMFELPRPKFNFGPSPAPAAPVEGPAAAPASPPAPTAAPTDAPSPAPAPEPTVIPAAPAGP